MTYIRDPDQETVRFAYGDASRPNLVTRRTDRRGTPLAFTFSPSGRLTSARLPLAPGDTIITSYASVEDRGIGTSVPVATAYTLLDGPRTDVEDRTFIWPAERGAPRRIRDALGGETVIRRTDSRFPALPTEVTSPGGRRSTAEYDSRGRVSRSRVHSPLGDSRAAQTRYAYDDRWDAPTEIRTESVDTLTGAVTALAGTSYAQYDTLGNPASRQQGEIDTHLVRFS